MLNKIVISLAFLIFLAGCSSSIEDDIVSTQNELTLCESAMKKASEVPDTQDTHEDMYPAIESCDTQEEFDSAAMKYPEATGLTKNLHTTYLVNMCQHEEMMSVSPPLCQKVLSRECANSNPFITDVSICN